MDYLIVSLIIIPPIVGILVQKRLFERTKSLFLVKLLTALCVFPIVLILTKDSHGNDSWNYFLYFFFAFF